jgi:hypothetical protein
MQLTPLIAIHMTAALLAVVTGPVALWARKGATQRLRSLGGRETGLRWVCKGGKARRGHGAGPERDASARA